MNASSAEGSSGHQRVGGQMGELGHAQVGDVDEVLHRSEATRCRLCLLQQPVHGLHVGIAAPVQHAPHHAVKTRAQGLRQSLEGLQSATLGPRYPSPQGPACCLRAVGSHALGIHLA